MVLVERGAATSPSDGGADGERDRGAARRGAQALQPQEGDHEQREHGAAQELALEVSATAGTA